METAASIVIPAGAEDGGLGEILKRADVPQDLQEYFRDVCKVTSVQLFLSYVVRKDFESELKEIIVACFRVSESFTAEQQRLYVSKARGAYRVALDVEQAIAAQSAKRAADQAETDLEKNLDPETIKQIQESWTNVHDWMLTKSMRAAPPLRNLCFVSFEIDR